MGQALVQIGEDSNQPAGAPQDDRDQDEAVYSQLHAAVPAAEPALQERRGGLQQYGAYDRTP